MWFSEFPFLRYVFFFFLGIWVYPYVSVFPKEWFEIGLFFTWLFFSCLVLFVSYKPFFPFKFWIAFTAYFLLILLGIVFSSIKDIKNQPDHLNNQEKNMNAFMGVVRQFDEKKPKTIANRIALLKGVDEQGAFPLSGEVILYRRSGSALSPGQIVWVKGTPNPVSAPANPGEFDFRSFLLQQQITHQHFTSKEIVVLGHVNAFPLESFFIQLRAKLESKIDVYVKNNRSAQIAKALLLGQKKNLERDTQTAYSTAGAMHVLAVSGLHVGIIYGFFFLFFKPLKLPLLKRFIFLVFLIGLIWCYAFLTGLSPSVLRSATMFTLISLALLVNRTPSIFNPVAISAVLLLMYDPLVGFSVGFQLSYAALVGILLFQPLILKLWIPKNKVLEYFWQVSSVSMAAQITTLPISIYYFHTFPTFFLIANWIVIPAAFLIMAVGIPFLLLSLISPLAYLLGEALNHLLIYLNKFIFAIGHLPFAQITDLTIRTF
jgi:competence protein ComEC